MLKSNKIKKALTVVLALTGLLAMAYYAACRESCSYLSGDIFGIDLKYIGILFMVAVLIATVTGLNEILRLILATGIGGEVFLIGYQFVQGVFCPYCLTFAATLLLSFLLNYQHTRQGGRGWKRALYALGEVRIRLGGESRTCPLMLCTLMGFLIFVAFFTASPRLSYADDTFPRVYGTGPVEIRMYSDYFCNPCHTLEKETEDLFDQIVALKKGGIIFIDTPGHKDTKLYARYFFYAVCSDSSYEKARLARRSLFEAATQNISSEGSLMEFLNSKGIKTSLCPTSDYFAALTRYLKEDHIDSTPTCVIVSKQGKHSYTSRKAIVEALQNIIGKK